MTGRTVWPASTWQRFAVSLDRDRPGYVCGPGYTLSAILEVRGRLEYRVLNQAFELLVQRHELLRTRIDHERDGEPLQVVSHSVISTVEMLDPAEDLSVDALSYAPVAFDAPSPIRVRLAARSSHDHLLTIHIHHVMADPTTLWTVISELGALYSWLVGGPQLPEATVPYGEYAELESQLAAAARSADEQWWRGLLSPATSARTLRDNENGAGEGTVRSEILTSSELSALQRWARAHRNILFAALMAAMARSMAPQYETPGGLLFTTLFSRRDRPEWQHMVGPCTMPAYLWVPEPPESLSASYVAAVRDIVFGCYRHARLLDVAAVTGISMQEPAYGTYTVPFVEYLPREWPQRISFGPAQAGVVNAVGPLDEKNRRGLGMRTRVAAGGALSARLSWDGNGWTEQRTKRVCQDFRDQVNHLVGDQPRIDNRSSDWAGCA